MFLLRHGQSYFNLHFTQTRQDPGIEDPTLTPLGVQQAEIAAERLAGVKLTRVIISPYTRALQTAAPILAGRGLRAEIMHEVRERTAFVCDVGSHPDELARRFPQHDFAHLPAKWWRDGVETAEETIARANAFRAVMANRRDAATTLLVSHWAFILALTGISVTNGEMIIYDPRDVAPERIVWRP
ncbi:MAG: histidine phosphatase family protein [Acidocella sp.]|nr:histidine phosphatase family protein [Acidocella sp.]